MTSASSTQGGPSLNADGRRRLDALTAGDWAHPGEHPMAALDGARIGTLNLVVLLGPKNNVGARYFQLFGADGEGRLSDDRIALGMFNSGLYPAFNWVELTHYEPVVAFGEAATDLRAGEHEQALFEMLSALVPRGGHLMVEYDSPSHEATARILTLGYPPVTTPLGYRLFLVGVRSYRDWYISEGGREGPRKLQGFKPLNEEIAREKTAALSAEVQRVLRGGAEHGEWGQIARRNAAAVAEVLQGQPSSP
jgi:hypothetical protein